MVGSATANGGAKVKSDGTNTTDSESGSQSRNKIGQIAPYSFFSPYV